MSAPRGNRESGIGIKGKSGSGNVVSVFLPTPDSRFPAAKRATA
jgi:hypothetical protein